MAPELPQYWHFSRLPGSLMQGTGRFPHQRRLEFDCFSVEDIGRLTQGFVLTLRPGAPLHRGPPRHRHVIDSVLMVCGAPQLKEHKQPEAAQKRGDVVT
jgi:hypothetical protein